MIQTTDVILNSAAYMHTEFRKRFIEQWQEVAVPRFSWAWRTR